MEIRLPRYHRIYEQLYENPIMPLYKITKSTNISRSTISRYLEEMYELSIIKGPLIFVKPAQNCCHYANFLQFDYPLDVYRGLKGFPHIINRTVYAGKWNILLICDHLMNFPMLRGFRKSIVQGVKGVTYLPKVTSFDWDTAMKKIDYVLTPPTKKSTLFEKIPFNPWNEKEWKLYHSLKSNVRQKIMPILKACRVRFERYQKWISALPTVANIYPAFYPQGQEKYFAFDFLFESRYHKQLADILGMLPSTSVFFSVNEYLMARLHFLDKKELDDLFDVIFRLKDERFFTHFNHAVVISPVRKKTSQRGDVSGKTFKSTLKVER